MQKFLATYLIVTGAGAFVALAFPSLVVLGLFLLVLPGLILGFAPTAFLWGCIFAAIWWVGRMVLGDAVAIVPALLVTVLLLVAIPSFPRQAGQRLLDASLLPDVAAAAPIALRGDVRLDRSNPRGDNLNRGPDDRVTGFACDNLCIGLLFTPGVTSVTVNSSADFTPQQHRDGEGSRVPRARTFRLLPKAQCGNRGIKVDLAGRSGLFGKTLDENRRIEAEWNLKLASDYCVVAEPPLARFDIAIREGRYRIPEGEQRFPSSWSLARGPAEIEQVEIRDAGGQVLLRRLVSRVQVLARPFHISGSGGIENFRFGWGRSTLTNGKRYESVDLLKILEVQTTIAGRTASDDLLPLVRRALKRAVADPALPGTDPAFRTIEAYFDGIKAAPLGEEDLALVTALILDDRLTEYPGLWTLRALPAEQQRRIGDAIVLRLLAAKDPLALHNAPFSDFLAKSPPGSFATLSDDQQALLASPERRILARGLVARLSDGGSAMVPVLLDLIRYHGPAFTALRESRDSAPMRSRWIEGHLAMIGGARVSLCRLGPAAASALPQVEALIADGTIPAAMLNGFGGTDWNMTLLRLGKPLAEIRKPPSLSGTRENYLRNLQRRLDRFDPEKSCDR
jgi:hypothetical protein